MSHTSDAIDFDVAEGRHRRVQEVGYAFHVVVLVLAAIGAWLAWARRALDLRAVVVLGSGIGVALLTAVAVYGSARLRAPAEPALAVLAAFALAELSRRTPAGAARPPRRAPS